MFIIMNKNPVIAYAGKDLEKPCILKSLTQVAMIIGTNKAEPNIGAKFCN